MLITSIWYTRRQQPTIIGLWYSFNGIGIAIGGILGYAIGNVNVTLSFMRDSCFLMSFSDRRRVAVLEIRVLGKQTWYLFFCRAIIYAGRFSKFIGALCSAWGIVLWILIPDSPAQNRWFTRRERVIVVSRKREDHTGTEKRQYVML